MLGHKGDNSRIAQRSPEKHLLDEIVHDCWSDEHELSFLKFRKKGERS